VRLLAPALPRFRARHPKLSIDLRLSDRFVDLIEEGTDVAIRVGELADSRLIGHRLAPYRLCTFAAPTYLAKCGMPRHPEDLVRHDRVNFRYQSSGQILRWPFRVGGRTLEVVPGAAVATDVSDAVTTILSAAGIGIAATFIAAPHMERGELVPVLAEFAVDRSAITAPWPESRRGSPNEGLRGLSRRALPFTGALGRARCTSSQVVRPDLNRV
jgi:DNA-binding transcriptional LysR family regulator